MRKQNEFSRYYNSSHFGNLCFSVILDVLEKLGTARSLSIAIAIRHKSIDKQLFETEPSRYFDAHSYQLDTQAIALVKKSLFLDFGINEDTVYEETVQKWLTIEDSLKKTNLEIRSRKNFELTSTLESARKIISNLLPSIDSIQPRSQPIPKGATALLKGLNVNIANKLEVLDITSSAFRHYKNYYGVSSLTRGFDFIATSLGSTFEVVPKDCFKKRTIAKEPMGNMILQLDAAKVLRRALGRVGINLQNQQEFHGFLVRRFFDEFATIDLSDASDRISVELVKALLPEDWFNYLNDIRSKFTFLPCGRRIELEKFSPQGNGFTFELETLIFYAICRTVVPERELVSVYGDDMIVPVSHADCVQDALVNCGLVVNFDKSYNSGRFRESCGVDTFDGFDVRPVYFKEFSEGLFGYYELANRVYSISERTGVQMNRPLKRIIDYISQEHRCFGPEILGDSVLHAYTLYVDRIPSKTRYFITELSVLQKVNLPYKTISLFDKKTGKVKKKTLKHKYITICDDLKTDRAQLSYALCGFPMEGVTQRNSPYRERIQKCAL